MPIIKAIVVDSSETVEIQWYRDGQFIYIERRTIPPEEVLKAWKEKQDASNLEAKG